MKWDQENHARKGRGFLDKQMHMKCSWGTRKRNFTCTHDGMSKTITYGTRKNVLWQWNNQWSNPEITSGSICHEILMSYLNHQMIIKHHMFQAKEKIKCSRIIEQVDHQTIKD